MKNFEEIYEEHNVAMIRVARKMVSDTDVVSDIVQEVFIYLHQKLSEGTNILHLRSWLYRATFNKCVDHLRRQHRHVDIEDIRDVENKDNPIAVAELKDAISLAMAHLNPQEKVMVVSYSEGLSYKEIADLTGIKFNSIGKTLSRALKKLEKEMKKETYGLH